MAVVHVESTQVLDRLSTPPTANGSGTNGGRVYKKQAYVSVTAGDDADSTYAFFWIPKKAIIFNVELYSTGIDGAVSVNECLFDIGVGTMDPPSTTPVDVDVQTFLHQTLFSIPSTSMAEWKDITFLGSNSYDFGSETDTAAGSIMTTPLWQLFANTGVTTDTSDPGGDYIVYAKAGEDVSNGGLILLQIEYGVPI